MEEAGDQWDQWGGWSGVDALMSMFDTADAAEETGAPDTAPRAGSKFEARARLYDGRIPYAEKATEADGLIRDLAGWKPEDGDDAGALQLANVLV